ncbi:MAG: hypothetical protein ACI30W_01690, partial [Muribaculaceae bacterium]
WRDYYTTALEISAYLSYVSYEVSADYTIAHITLTPRYRAQILAAAPPSDEETTPPPATTASPTTNNATPAPEPAAPAAPAECSESATNAATTPAPEPSECSEISESSSAAANSRLKAATTASLKGSLCISRGQGRRGRPQPSDSRHLPIKPERRNLAPQKPRHTQPIAMPPPQPDHPPPHRVAPR